ncbi:MAG TPA: PAS domain-containing sensor histidine kinase [Noviherbaspirillum sp.]|uniref:sensor histidine kinase n=1 Tax=Noviherbaspirillum sp. TaxID=1926288 RepID=UPI002B46466C|nr:PAS domain-containing sensor histidine kinase [Noviherbaspirillum sp.]HJV88235.1 PAS domain-containing sensor histidine kinase [Noviherbaspirillum sp.]
MTTQLEYNTGTLPNFITTLSRFPASKVGPSLLSIIQSAMDGVIIVDASRQIVLVNQKVERMFGYPAKHLLEKSLDLLMPPRISVDQRRRIDRLVATRVHGRRSKLELKGVHSNGAQLSLNASISRVTVHGELFLALILHDALPRTEALTDNMRGAIRASDLRRWAVSSQQVNEAEKRRFSRKLYDDIGQRLSVLKLDLDWLENSLPTTNEGLPARLAQMQGLLDNVIMMTKNMASTLRPPLLDDFGLLPAVEWMAENFQKKTSVKCTVESHGLMAKLDDPIESAIFRVIQEGLSNIERHAHASQAKITLVRADDQVNVMIRDDGIGMDPGSEGKAGCYGLIAMQERIFMLGGTITIRNVEPQGVAIHASIPIEPILLL